MSHIRPASWQHWADTLKASKSTFKQAGVVHTSRTLFIAQVPQHCTVADLEAAARPCPGFIAARRVRGMGFLDFDSKQQATNAIGKLQGHKFKPNEKGLLISYDKDDEEDRGGASKRQMEELRRRRQELEDSYTKLCCVACSHFACKITVSMAELPIRKTDGSRVVGSDRLVSLECAKGPSKAIKRAKGVEKQFWLNCVHCDVTLAYRSTPFGQPGKYVYLIEKTLCTYTARHSGAGAADASGDGDAGEQLRPGEWFCPVESCRNHNWACRDHCRRCGIVKPMESVAELAAECRQEALATGQQAKTTTAAAAATQLDCGSETNTGAPDKTAAAPVDEEPLPPLKRQRSEVAPDSV
eukprot:COSAG05_NODE_798_length_7245_cov_46.630982_4_plen_355_part_00